MYREAMTSIPALFLSLTIVCAGTAASAQDLTAEDRAAIAGVAAELEADVRAGDFAGTLDVIPPAMLTATLERFGVTEDELRQTLDAQMKDVLETVTFQTFSIAVDDAVPAKTPGVGRRYALIPTETVVTVEGAGGMRSHNQTLAVEEQGKWYLIRIDDQGTIDMLRAVYPDFATIEFQPGTTEALD